MTNSDSRYGPGLDKSVGAEDGAEDGADVNMDTPEGMKSYLSQRLMMAAPCLSDSQETPTAPSTRPAPITCLYAQFESNASLISLGGRALSDAGNATTIRKTPSKIMPSSLSMLQALTLDILVFSGEVCRRRASAALAGLRPDPTLPCRILEVEIPHTFSSHQLMQAHAMAAEAKLGRATPDKTRRS